MFNFFKKKDSEAKDTGIMIGAPVAGKVVPLSEVSDATFSGELLGKGVAVIPSEGKIYAPADGTLEMVFDTLHAFTMTTTEGAEILVHIGLDTVELKGEHFTAHKAAGDAVKKGDLLITVDFDAVKAAGYDVVTPMIICNTDSYADVESLAGKEAAAGEDVLRLVK